MWRSVWAGRGRAGSSPGWRFHVQHQLHLLCDLVTCVNLVILITHDGTNRRMEPYQGRCCVLHGGSSLKVQTRELRQFALPCVEGAKLSRAEHERGCNVQNVEAPAADAGRVMLSQILGFPLESAPQIGLRHQQTRRQILLVFLPSRDGVRSGQALLKYGEAQGVAEFEPMKAGEIERDGVRLTQSVRFG